MARTKQTERKSTKRASSDSNSGAAGAAAAAGGTGGAAPAAFRGPAADSVLGELLVDALPLAFAAGHALDLSHCAALCGATRRKGAISAVIARCLREQTPQWLAAGRRAPREDYLGGTRTTLLMRAAREGSEERVRALVAAGAPVDLVDGELWSALHWASLAGCAPVVKLLLSGKAKGRGAAIDRVDKDGMTPLLRAVQPVGGEHEAVVTLLVKRGASQIQQDLDGNTAMHKALIYHRAAILAILAEGIPSTLAKRPSAASIVSLQNKQGLTPAGLAERLKERGSEYAIRNLEHLIRVHMRRKNTT